ncbi:hypothetical protein KI387_030025, partial [Taxus chinensis]
MEGKSTDTHKKVRRNVGMKVGTQGGMKGDRIIKERDGGARKKVRDDKSQGISEKGMQGHVQRTAAT